MAIIQLGKKGVTEGELKTQLTSLGSGPGLQPAVASVGMNSTGQNGQPGQMFNPTPNKEPEKHNAEEKSKLSDVFDSFAAGSKKAVNVSQSLLSRNKAARPAYTARRGQYELYNGSILLSEGEIIDVPAAERFRILRAQIEKQNLSGKKSYHIISVTSAVPEEGKSVVSVNLARALSLDPTSKTLLIDCDLRRPTIHEYWGMERGPGLTDLLTRGASLESVVRPIARGLDLIPAGNPVPDPAQAVEQPVFARYLQELRKHYRYIIVDCPPVLLCPEPITISSVVEGTLLVVRGWRTEKRLVQDAVEALGKNKIMGVVMNDGMDSSKQYQYYRYYGNPVRKNAEAAQIRANVSLKDQ